MILNDMMLAIAVYIAVNLMCNTYMEAIFLLIQLNQNKNSTSE